MATNPPRTGASGAPPSAADTKNLTDAINKLTQTLGQNDSTMKDLSKKETDLSKTMKAVGEFTEDFTDSLIKQDLALGLAVKGLTSAGKGIGGLLGFGKKKDGKPGATAGGGDVAVGTERMGADGYIYVFKGKQWVLKAGQKDKTTGKKLGNRIAPKAVAAGLFGKVGRPATGASSGASASPASPAGVTSTPDTGGGMGSMLAPDYSTSAKAGFGIAAVGAGIAGFIAALALGGAAVNALGGASGVKDMLSAVGEGLSSFNTQSLVGFGSLLAAGAIFGAVAGPKTEIGAGIGLTMIGLGIGGFFAGLSLGAVGAAAIGGPAAVKDMLMAVGEGLGSFNTQSLAALGSMLAAGALFGAVGGTGAGLGVALGANLGIAVIGLAIGGFFTALAAGAKGFKALGGPENVKDMLSSVAEGLNSYNSVDGTNLLKVAGGLAILAPGIAAFAAGDLIGKVIDWFSGDSNDPEDSVLAKVAKSLMYFEDIDGANLKDAGDGILSLSQGLMALANMPPIDTKNMQNVAASLNMFQGGNLPGGGGGGATTPMSSPGAGGAPLTPTGQNVQVGGTPNKQGGVTADKTQLMQYFMSQGYSKDEAAAIVGNFQLESGLNTAAKGDKNMAGGASVGLGQWREGRLANLQKFAADNNMDINDPMTQAKFANFELQNDPGNSGNALKKLRAASAAGAGPEQLAEIFGKAYERPGVNKATGKILGIEERTSYAAQLAKADIPAIGDNLNVASAGVENAQMSPTVVVAPPAAAGGGAQQAPKTQAAAPAISSGRPAYASVAGANYRGFQVSDISA